MRLMCEQPGIMADKELPLKPQREYMWTFSNTVTNTVYQGSATLGTGLTQGLTDGTDIAVLYLFIYLFL